MKRLIPDTIFIRILLASLIPVILIFTTLLVMITNTIFSENAGFAREKTFDSIDYALKLTNNKFADMAAQVTMVGENLRVIDRSRTDAKEAAQNMLLSLLRSDDDIYCAWFVFEPGVFGETRYTKDYIMEHGSGELKEIFDLTEEQLNDPLASPWFNIPFRSGETFINGTNSYDYGIGEGTVYMCTIACPMLEDGRVIGVVAIDILYGVLFKAIDSMQDASVRQVHLISEDGTFVYPKNDQYFGRKLSDLPFPNIAALTDAVENHHTVIEETNSPLSGERSLIYLQPIDLANASAPLFLYVDLSTSSLYHNAYVTTGVIVATGVAGLLLLLGSIFFTTRNIARPIRKLTDNANQIAHGQLAVSFEQTEKSNEIAVLERALREMLHQLGRTHELELTAMEARYEKQKAEENVAAKNRYFATMSHELRTPMNVILGMSELLLADELGDAQRKYAQGIKHSTESLLRIINDILDLAKIEDESLSLCPTHYDFGLMMDNINAVIGFLCEQKGLAYQYEAAADCPRYLYGDDVRLRQVLLNVAGNAVKYTREGTIGLRVATEDGSLRFTVTDTGIGIKPEHLTLIFDPFAQADGDVNKHIQGTGLGLPLSKKLLEMMNGRITAESVYGAGSVFHITVPVVPGHAEGIEKRDESLDKLYAPALKVLVVDDNDVNLSVAEGLLRLSDIRCDTALSGAEAFEMVQRTAYDIVFMDHMMPIMDGAETTQRIRALGGEYKQLVVIALTANASATTRELLLSIGMNDFLTKPVEKNKLQRMLRKWAPADKLTTASGKSQRPPETDGYSPVIRNVSAIQGVDVSLGLQRMGGQQRVFEKTLRLLNDRLPEYIENLRTSLRGGVSGEFARQIHSVKGLLATVGAAELSARALELEKAARLDDLPYCEAHIEGFCDELHDLSYQLDTAVRNAEERE